MSNAKRRLLSNVMLMSMLAGASTYSLGSKEHHEPTRCKTKEEIAGYEHKGKTPARLEQRRKNRQRLKAKRNAKKGIYQTKIKYPKKRS